MKKLVIITLLFTINIINAQELSYGVVLANSFFEIGNNNGSDHIIPNKTYLFNPGVYGEYNFNENIGIKTELFFKNRDVTYQISRSGFTFISDFELSHIEINPNFKYDFGDEYRKGFYMLAGPKLNFLTKAKSDGEDAKDVFESFYVGAQLGFGWRIFQYVDIQTKLEYDVMPFFKTIDNHQSNFVGIVFSANIDLAKLLSKE